MNSAKVTHVRVSIRKKRTDLLRAYVNVIVFVQELGLPLNGTHSHRTATHRWRSSLNVFSVSSRVSVCWLPSSCDWSSQVSNGTMHAHTHAKPWDPRNKVLKNKTDDGESTHTYSRTQKCYRGRAHEWPTHSLFRRIFTSYHSSSKHTESARAESTAHTKQWNKSVQNERRGKVRIHNSNQQ